MKHGLGRNENGGKKTGALSARLLFVSLLQYISVWNYYNTTFLFKLHFKRLGVEQMVDL
jgi:hypothetical protein